MSDENSPATAIETPKTNTVANPSPVLVEHSAPVTSAPQKTTEVNKEEELDDEEYEVEYVYEDEDDEENSEEVIEVDEESDPTEKQQETLPLDDEEEDVVEVYDEYDEEEEAVDDAEFDRIANRIDELLSKTSTLQANTTPSLSAAVLSSEPMSEEENLDKETVPEISADKQLSSLTEPSVPINTEQVTTVVETKQPLPAETALKPSELTEKNEENDDEEYEVEYVDEEEEEMIELDEEPQPPPKKASPPIERSSTVEDNTNLSLPGQLRHVNNQWNISDLRDEEMLEETPKSDNENVNRDETMTPVGDLGTIKEEESVETGSCKEKFFEQTEPREMPLMANRFGHQSLSEAMADEDEVNEIEIALEDWKEGDLEGVLEEEEEEEEVEEEDENDEVDPVMPDNLLLHANDQIEQIDVPLSPSPTPSYPGSPTTRRPVSPSSLILSRVRNLVIAGQLEPLEELLSATPNFFIDAILKAGWTALMYASYRGYPDIVQFCLQRGSDPNYHKEFFTSLMAICSSGNGNEGQLTQCLALLVNSGARLNAVDKFGCSPLHYAARFGRAKLTEQLIANGADVNHANRNGWTALHWAAAENHEEVVATLLDHNVDVLLETRDGVTASELAAIRKNKYIAEALHDFEQSELKALAETELESQVLQKQITTNQLESDSNVSIKNNENIVSLEPTLLTEKSVDKKREFERNLSQEEIESRKEEAREIVINAIDAALARNIGKLINMPTVSSENELRKRPVDLDNVEESNVTVSTQHEGKLIAPAENTSNQIETNAHNIVMSLAIAAAIFFFFKLMWYFSS